MEKSFYEFTQNNSGGGFDTDGKLCHRLFIEADTESEACDIAESMGVYFNGCDDGMDCPCCGDRWYRPWSSLDFPYEYGAFEEKEANKLGEKYGSEVIEKDVKKNHTPARRFYVVFKDVEAYAQYLSDEYGWTDPDARVFYSDGTVVEIK